MRYKLRHIWIAAALALGACSQEATDGETGGAVPMELTASGLQSLGSPMTRSTVDGDWEGFDLPVAVKMGDVVKKYKVTEISSDKKKAKLSSTDPLYWPVSGKAKVMAWYPAGDKPSIMVEKDQSGDGYAKSDCLLADEQEVTLTKNGSSNLEFTHRTAKIRVALTDADKTASVKGATVALDMDGTPVVTKCYNPENTGDYLALVVPTNDGETAVLTVRITVNGDDQEYVYTHSEFYAFEANHQYVFKLKLDGYKAVLLDACTIKSWTDNDMNNGGEGIAKDLGYSVVEENGKTTYKVTSAKGLTAWAEAVKNSTGKDIDCVLDADITMPAVASGESNWTPVGDKASNAYNGTFDGNNHTIKGLRVNLGSTNNVGFFGCIGSGGTVKNLTLADAVIKGRESVGAVAADNQGTISHCYVTNSTVSGSGFVGGIAGNSGGTGGSDSNSIQFCGVTGSEVTGTTSTIGGIVGNSSNCEAVGCYAVCELTGSDNVGGIAGTCNKGKFTACYSSCTFSSSGGYVGGIVGQNNDNEFSACYWNTHNVGTGVGDDSDPTGMTRAYSWTETVMNVMNKELEKADSEYEYSFVDGSSVPYKHVLRNKQQ